VSHECVTLYRSSRGRFHTGWQVERRLHHGIWKPCLHELGSDRRLVGDDEGLLALVPVPRSALPEWLWIRVDGAGPRVVDLRRHPPDRHVTVPGPVTPGGGGR